MPPAAEELVRRAQSLKQEGNELHINKEYKAAVAKYAAAKSDLKPILSWPKAASLTRSCSLNEASCYIQLEDWKSVEDICSSVLATDGRNLKALYRRGLAYKKQAENIKVEGSLACEQDQVEKHAGDTEGESGIIRSKSLLVLAFKDLGAANTLDKTDPLVETSFKNVKEAMEAVGIDCANIPLDISPPPQISVNGGGGMGQWGGGIGGMKVKHTRNAALAQAVLKNTSAVREGASVLRKLDTKLVLDLVCSSHGNGMLSLLAPSSVHVFVMWLTICFCHIPNASCHELVRVLVCLCLSRRTSDSR